MKISHLPAFILAAHVALSIIIIAPAADAHRAKSTSPEISGSTKKAEPVDSDKIRPSYPAVEPSDTIAYPDHTTLLIVRDATGAERAVKTPEDWAERVAHIKAGMQLVMGPLPAPAHRTPLEAEITAQEKTAKYLRYKVHFTPEIGDRVPAWLLVLTCNDK